jgi:hypothetical protein
MEHDVVLTLWDGSVRHFRVYGGVRPHPGDVITLPVNGKPIKARVYKADCVIPLNRELNRPADHPM